MLSRAALRRVLQSLLTQERAAARGRRDPASVERRRLPAAWPDTLRMMEGADPSLGCDSLEILHLGAAANEMFHLHDGGHEADLLEIRTFGGWLDFIEAATAGDEARVTFLTSGSTGLPKRCCHAAPDLVIEAGVLAQRFADRRRFVTLVPAHHIYGFIVTALLPDRLGVEVWAADRSGPGDLARGLLPGDLVIGFPERWAWLDRSLADWPPDVIGVTSTAPCPAALIASLLERGLSGMVEIYGSSETAGIALREAPGAYTLMPQWRFADPAGDDAPTLIHTSGHRIAPQDRIGRVDDRAFHIQGRHDGAVQVGGVNVHPDAVAALLMARPGVAQAAVRFDAAGPRRTPEGLRGAPARGRVQPARGRSHGLGGRDPAGRATPDRVRVRAGSAALCDGQADRLVRRGALRLRPLPRSPAERSARLRRSASRPGHGRARPRRDTAAPTAPHWRAPGWARRRASGRGSAN